MPASLIVRDLRKSYGKIEAARGVSFQVQEGEIFGLLGPNGAGKTTTVECIVGLREPDSGHIELFGIDARRYPGEVKQKIGAALQTTSLQDKITPREALKVFGAFYRNRSEPQELLDRFALADKADVAFDTLSGGQRQRLALALAFVNKPKLILLDEPSSGLDPHARRDLHNEILRMKSDRYTVLLTTHNVDEAERLCDRVAIMRDGQIVASGAPRDLIAQSAATTSVFLATAEPFDPALIKQLRGVENVVAEGPGIRFTARDVTQTLAELLALLSMAKNSVIELRVHKASLEDVLIETTGDKQ